MAQTKQKRFQDLQDILKTMYQNLIELCPLDQLMLMSLKMPFSQ